MTDRLPPYPAYNDSGVAWLGQIPSHWEVCRLKSRLVKNESGIWNDRHDPHGTIVLRSTEQTISGGWRIENPARLLLSPEERETYLLQVGDLLVTKSSGSPDHIGKTSLVTEEIASLGCAFSNFMQRLRVNNDTHPKLVWYFFNSSVGREQLIFQSTTTTGLGNLNAKMLGNCAIALPPLDEQAAIVRVLDFVDGRMRRYARAQQQTIRLLTEYKQALIHHAVTGKVNVCTGAPYPTYRDTGIEWLGQVPTHWQLKPLKHWVRINARTLPETTSPDYEFRYIDIGTVGTGLLLKEPQPLRFGDAPSRARRVVQAGDTIISTVRTYLKAVYHVQEDEGDLVCSTGFAVLTPGAGAHPKYVSYLVQSDAFASCVSAESVGTAYPAITEGRLGRFYVPVPPLAEQGAIVEYLDAQTARIDAAIAAVRRTVALVGEYRERLVADVVTGKVDVRAVAAGLPEADDAADAGEADALLTPFAPDDAPTLEEALQDATDGHE